MKQGQTFGAALLVGAGLMWWAERRWPRRVGRETPCNRLPVNLALGAMSLGVVALVERPLAGRVALRVKADRLGLTRQFMGQDAKMELLRDLAGVVLLDLATYGWHIATHRVPLLWRLHAVHHGDQDMDWTTALRFHVVDLMLAVPLRMAQVRLLGVSPRSLQIYGAWFFSNVAFHHANLKLPFDRQLAWFLTSPGMHDIHHRADVRATDSNYSSGFSVWDRAFRTFSDSGPVPPVPIGIAGRAADGSADGPLVRFGKALRAPFVP